jgi:hypothetical protein
MIEIKGVVVGAEAVVFRFSHVGDLLREHVQRDVTSLAIELQGKVRSNYLSGQALHVRSGRLRNSINARTVVEVNTFEGRVGTKVPYGRYWELGFNGIEHVRQHIRKVNSRNVFGAFEQKKRAKLAQGITVVSQHARTVNVSARPFLKPALDAFRPTIMKTLKASLGVI